MGGGGGSEVKETRSTTSPPAYLEPFLQQGAQSLTNLYQSGSAPEYYGGQTYADFSPQTQGAVDMITGRAQAGSPAVDAAGRNLTDTLNGQYLDPSTNPQFAAALEAGFRPQTEQFLHSVIPGITSAFEGSGRTGSGAHASVVNDATAGLSRAQADAAAKAGAAHYTTERSNQLAAAGLSPQIAAQDYLDAMQLAQAGATVDQQRQRGIDENVARYNYSQNKDWDYINRYLASLGAGYPGGTSFGTATGGNSSSGGLNSILGSAMGIGSLGMMLGGLFK